MTYTYGEDIWVNGCPPNAGAITNNRIAIIWRKGAESLRQVALDCSMQHPQHSNLRAKCLTAIGAVLPFSLRSH
jgi:coenzyme F420-reducing hydrogenase gamma subunit